MTTAADTLLLLRTRPGNHSLPRFFYTDPGLFDLDMDAVFNREWLCVGAECEVAAPGQFITVSVGEAPILVVRGTDGAVRAFHNVCRHRGSRLLDEACGTAKGLVCPYHRWTYRLDGSLSWAPHMGDGFDKDAHGLRPIHVRLVGGTVFVCLAEHAPDLSPFAAGVEPLLAPHALGRAKVAHEEKIVIAGNWKLVMENSRECYHCAAQHRPLMKFFLDQYDFRDPAGHPLIGPFWARMEAEGLPCHVAEGPDFRANRLPFTNGAVSTTVDGKPAVARLLGDVPHGDVGSLRWVHYPTTFNHALGDYAVLVRLMPLSPTTTEVSTKWLVDRDAVEGRDYALDRLREIWGVTNDEDAALVARNQVGVNSPFYEPGPYSPELEGGVDKFVEWYCGKLARHLGAPALAAVA